jgi:Acyl-CoA thioesterase C-terminal domain/Acyl-CoA thioesterase N-terminal domain
MSSAFYVSDGGVFVSSELTRGPWDPDAQHAGPPAALIGRELERCQSPTGETDWQLGRITCEILRPVPIAPLRVSAEVVRPGKSVELLSATLADDQGALITASAWRIARRAGDLPADLPVRRDAPPGPDEGSPRPFFDTGHPDGYHSAMEYRFISGGFLEPGPATVWMRMGVALVEGEEPRPLQRVLAAADTGNGVSAVLDLRRFLFINVDLSVHLHRMPAGEWICLDAVTTPEATGVGFADTALHDEGGPIGRALQTLLIRDR